MSEIAWKPTLRHLMAVYRSLPVVGLDGQDEIDAQVRRMSVAAAKNAWTVSQRDGGCGFKSKPHSWESVEAVLLCEAGKRTEWAFAAVMQERHAPRVRALQDPAALEEADRANKLRESVAAKARSQAVAEVRHNLDSKKLTPLAVKPLRDVRDGQLAAAGDAWEEGRE